MNLTPYLNFNGTCAAAFRFYADTLGGQVEYLQTHGDSPMQAHVPPDWHDKVIHACVAVNGQRLMGSDAPAEHFTPAQGMHVSVHVASVD
jgi:PhnB protein